MARLQDFQTVTPTSSDKLLVVQSQGQGLVPYGSKLNSANPTGTGSLSLNRKSNTTEGNRSVAVGNQCTASKADSFACGTITTASGDYGSFSTGANTEASGNSSFAEGEETQASGSFSHAHGKNTIANHRAQLVFGEYNEADTSSQLATQRGNYIEIVGKGTSNNARSNARTLDWSGNEVLAGGLKVNGNQDVATNIAISKTSLAIGQVASWDSAFADIPNGYCGLAVITFSSSQNVSCLINKYSAQYGTIMGIVDDNANPYFYCLSNGTSTLHRLAYV